MTEYELGANPPSTGYTMTDKVYCYMCGAEQEAASAVPDADRSRTVNESEWQKQVLKSAHQLGWQSMHIGRTGKYQKVGAKGTMGTGWPDLVLVKGGRIIFAELKAQDESLSPEQKAVLEVLLRVADCYIWRPSDFGHVLDILAV